MFTKILNVSFTLFILTILFVKFKLSGSKEPFWEDAYKLTSNRNSYWYAKKTVLFYLLTSALENENDMHLCILYNTFKDVFQKRDTPEEYMVRMQEACKRENTPDTFDTK